MPASPVGQVRRPARGYPDDVASPVSSREAQERRRRRQELLDTLREAAELRARLKPRAAATQRSRALLHARTTRG